MHRAHITTTIIWALLGLLEWGSTASLALPPAGPAVQLDTTKYLFPILAYGPNNQISSFKEQMALARLLNRTLMVHDLVPHYRELPKQYLIPFHLLFNTDELAKFVNITTLNAVVRRGWDRRLQAVVYFGEGMKKEIPIRTRPYHVVADKAALLPYPAVFPCTAEQIAMLRAATASYQYLAVASFDSFVPWTAGGGVELFRKQDVSECLRLYLKGTQHIVKSKWVDDLAKDFALKHLAAKYLAVHIRPSGDFCLEQWIQGTIASFDPVANPGVCDNYFLFHSFVEQTQQLLRQHGLSQVFVAAHPGIHTLVRGKYAAAGIEPVFLDEAAIEPLLKRLGPTARVTLLMIVEEELCAQAEVFAGTHHSSISGMIAQQRISQGRAPQVTLQLRDS